MLFAAAWVLGAVLLWRTTVPRDVHVPHVDPGDYFTPHQLHRTEHYDGFLRWLWLVGTIVQLAVLVALVPFGPRLARAFDLGKVGTGVLLGTFATLVLWLAGLPFGFLGLWWDRRYHVSKQSYVEWLLAQWPSLLGQVVGLTILLTFLMLLAGWLRRRWWLVAAPVLLVVGAGLVFLVSFAMRIGTHPVGSPRITHDIASLERKEHVSGTPVRVEKVSDETPMINAEAVGPAQASAVILWDTLFDGRLGRREIDVVIAHELGHVARKHLWKGIGWSVLFTFPVLFLLYEATRRRGGLHRPEVVPFALLVIALLNLVSLPLENVISRHIESEADWRALVTTRDPKAARKLFHDFAVHDLAQPRPPAWDYVMLENHPTVVQRIAMANAWETRSR